ncbi:MAG: HNH endonuclease, partial [Flavipsychrobacter sp.]
GSLMGMFHTLQTQHPTQFLSYMTAITTDATLYADQYYAGALPPKLQPIVNAYGVKSRVTAFFDSWSGAHAELTSVNSTNALLQVKYNESPLTYVNAFEDGTSDASVDSAIASVAGLSVPTYVSGITSATGIVPNTLPTQNVLQKDNYYLAEHDLYGSSRIGIKQYYPSQFNATYDYTTSPATVDTLRLFNTVPWYSLEYQDDIIAGDVDLYGHALLTTYGTQHQAGQRQYEITDHLGDVLATLSDKRRGIDPGHTGNITNYVPSPVALYDYYPFGMLMPGRYVYDTANHCELVTETAPVLTTSNLGWPFLGNWCRPCGFTAVAGGIITFGGSSMTTSSTAAGDGSSLDVSTVSGTAYSGSITTSGMTGGSWTATAMDITSSTILAATTIAQPQTAALNFTAIGPSTRITLTATAASSTFTITAIPFNFTTWTAGTIVTTVCSKDGDAYRYGFNGKLKDNEYAGIGNHLDYGARPYDTRTGRPPTVDPLTKQYPWLSPYQFFSDNPIRNIDIDGMEGAGAVGGSINWSYFYSSLGIRGNDEAAAKDFTKNVIVPAAKYAAKQSAIFVGTAVAGEVLEPLIFGEELAPAVDATYVKPPYEPETIVETPGTTKVQEVKSADYSSVPDPKNAGPGKKFTPAQKKAYIKENMKQNGGVIKSDKSGETLDMPVQSKKGVKANMKQAEVDHIIPRSKGGKNTSDNAQILSKEENLKKSNN